MQMTRRRAIAALGSTMLMPIVAGNVLGATQSVTDKIFANVAHRWLDMIMRLSPVSATQQGDHRFDSSLDDMSAAGRNKALAFAKTTLAEVDKIDRSKLSRANQVDAALLTNALRSQIWSTETLQDWAWNPLVYQNVAGGAVYTLMAREFAPVQKRLAAAARRMALLPAFLRQAREELVPARVPAPHAETYSQQNKGLKSIIDELVTPHLKTAPAALRTTLEAAIKTYNAAIDEHQAWIDTTLVPAAKADFRAGSAVFDTQLGFKIGRAHV